jgi:hypothetical protein
MFRRIRDFVIFLHRDDLVIRSPIGIALCTLLAVALATWSLLNLKAP